MKVMTIRSGSNANCIYINNDTYGILVDAGAGLRMISCALHDAGQDFSRIAAIFITHEHIDHIRGLETILKKYKIPVFANEATLNAVVGRFPSIDTACFSVLPTGLSAACPNLRVTSFKTSHDAVESVGYTITDSKRTLSVVTDLGVVTETVLCSIGKSNAVVLESNYDEAMLKGGKYTPSLKRRILSANGHLSNDDCALTASVLAQGGTQRIILAHLSENNNIPSIALKTTEKALTSGRIALGRDIFLEVASRNEASGLMDV